MITASMHRDLADFISPKKSLGSCSRWVVKIGLIGYPKEVGLRYHLTIGPKTWCFLNMDSSTSFNTGVPTVRNQWFQVTIHPIRKLACSLLLHAIHTIWTVAVRWWHTTRQWPTTIRFQGKECKVVGWFLQWAAGRQNHAAMSSPGVILG